VPGFDPWRKYDNQHDKEEDEAEAQRVLSQHAIHTFRRDSCRTTRIRWLVSPLSYSRTSLLEV
jgi:hypothetical protein